MLISDASPMQNYTMIRYYFEKCSKLCIKNSVCPLNIGFKVIIPLPLLNFTGIRQLLSSAFLLPEKPLFIMFFEPFFIPSVVVVLRVITPAFALFWVRIAVKNALFCALKKLINKGFSAVLWAIDWSISGYALARISKKRACNNRLPSISDQIFTASSFSFFSSSLLCAYNPSVISTSVWPKISISSLTGTPFATHRLVNVALNA